jgi:hypothetical protein
MSYNAPTLAGLISGGGKIYYDDQDLGVIDQNTATLASGFSVEGITSSIFGNTPIAWTQQGSEPTFTATIKNWNKAILEKLHHDLKVLSGGDATDPVNPATGNLEFTSNARVLQGKALVFYPFYTDQDGNKYTDTDTNPFTLAFGNALPTDIGDVEIGTDAPYMFEVTFGIGIEAGSDRYGLLSAGIATDGTYTQPI